MIRRLLIALVAASVLLASCSAVGTDPPATYTVTYNGNGNDIGIPPVDANQYKLVPKLLMKLSAYGCARSGAGWLGTERKSTISGPVTN